MPSAAARQARGLSAAARQAGVPSAAARVHSIVGGNISKRIIPKFLYLIAAKKITFLKFPFLLQCN